MHAWICILRRDIGAHPKQDERPRGDFCQRRDIIIEASGHSLQGCANEPSIRILSRRKELKVPNTTVLPRIEDFLRTVRPLESILVSLRLKLMRTMYKVVR